MAVQVCFGLSGNDDSELAIAFAFLLPQIFQIARKNGRTKEEVAADLAKTAEEFWDVGTEMP